MNALRLRRALPAATALLAMLAGCANLTPPETEEVTTYVLDAMPVANGQSPGHNIALTVSVPRARPGFESRRMAYVRQPYEVDYFTKSRWVDTPARMLRPLIAQALEKGGGFRAVVQNPSAVAGELRLETELVRLQQEFLEPQSRVRITLRAQLVDVAAGRIVATRELEETELAAGENAYAGVTAMNRALVRMLARLTEFCANAAASR